MGLEQQGRLRIKTLHDCAIALQDRFNEVGWSNSKGWLRMYSSSASFAASLRQSRRSDMAPRINGMKVCHPHGQGQVSSNDASTPFFSAYCASIQGTTQLAASTAMLCKEKFGYGCDLLYETSAEAQAFPTPSM
eukprot:1157788-Pelagomonas_calceolata.AAC.9